MTEAVIPEWTQGDRLRKALQHAEISVNDMADYFEVNRHTVSGWLTDRHQPRPAELKLFALRCGVPYGWLRGDVNTRSCSHLASVRPFPGTLSAA